MKQKNIALLLTFYLIILFNSCSSDDSVNQATVISFSKTGLLGEKMIIKLENFDPLKLQVFFDLEQAQISRFNQSDIEIIIPRSLKTSTSLLKIIDLRTNETILSEVFSLKKPLITGFSNNSVNFGETISVFGENFDKYPQAVTVTVNNEKATIIDVAYNRIDLRIPTKISSSELHFKVTAQLQEVSAPTTLQLKAPKLLAVENTVAWIRGQLKVTSENLNPNYEMGEVYVNGIKSNFYFYEPEQLTISMPPGPFSTFNVTNITYKTAGISSSLDCNVPIGNDGIMVDYMENSRVRSTIFTHNNKAYAFKSDSSIGASPSSYTLMAFSSEIEKWTELSVFEYSGTLADAVYDGSDTVYLYKSNGSTFQLTKLNMNTFQETSIDLPYGNQVSNPILFAFQDHLYMLSGLTYQDGSPVTAYTQKYVYSKAANTWNPLPASSLSSLPLVDTMGGSGKCRYVHHGNSIFIEYGIFYRFKISPNLTVTPQTYTPGFSFNNAIIGFSTNNPTSLYNMQTNASVSLQNDLLNYGGNFFRAGNEIYFHRNSWTEYYQNTLYVQKLRKEILNGIL